MSVDIEEWMIEDGLDMLHYIRDPTHGAVQLPVGGLRELGFQIGWDPDGGHDHHGSVWGIGNGSSRRRKVLRLAVTIRKAQGEV